MTDRAWVMLGSGWKLDLLDPSPYGFEDRDLAVGLSRTYRWAGCSRWEEPLSVAQHSLTVLAICRKEADRLGMRLSPGAALRELLRDNPSDVLDIIDWREVAAEAMQPDISAIERDLQRVLKNKAP